MVVGQTSIYRRGGQVYFRAGGQRLGEHGGAQYRAGFADGTTLFLGSPKRKMARQDCRHGSALRRLRAQRRAHGLLSSAIGAGIFAPALYRTSGDGFARLPPSHRLGSSKAVFDPVVRQRRRYTASQSPRSADQRFRHERMERRRRTGAGRLYAVVAGPVAPPKRFQGFHQLVAIARRANGGAARRRGERLAAGRYSKNRFTSAGPS